MSFCLGLQTCTQQWSACRPASFGTADTCCPGTSCQPVKAHKKMPYVCKPLPANCKPAGNITHPQTCGDCPGGGLCCPGLECRWDSHTRSGYCVDPNQCTKEQAWCCRDCDCCSNNRCEFGRCSSSVGIASEASACDKYCAAGDAECRKQRRKDCAFEKGALAASLGTYVQGA
jgi:hypothetical protein